MLKKTITYEDFNGDQKTEDLYFNLSKSELVKMETSVDGGLSEKLKCIIKKVDPKQIIDILRFTILASYGQKSDDGKRFVKNDAIRDDFEQTAAFDALFMDIIYDPDKAADFVNGIIPKIPDAMKQSLTNPSNQPPATTV